MPARERAEQKLDVTPSPTVLLNTEISAPALLSRDAATAALAARTIRLSVLAAKVSVAIGIGCSFALADACCSVGSPRVIGMMYDPGSVWPTVIVRRSSLTSGGRGPLSEARGPTLSDQAAANTVSSTACVIRFDSNSGALSSNPVTMMEASLRALDMLRSCAELMFRSRRSVWIAALLIASASMALSLSESKTSCPELSSRSVIIS